MNALVVGFDKTPLLDYVPDQFLIIDDGALIDALDLPVRRSITLFDPAHHTFNPLKGMDYRKAREFISLIDAIFPEGESTLTSRTSRYVLLKALLNTPRRLDTLISDTKDTHDAFVKIDTLLASPVLKAVLTRPTNLSFKGTLVARLNRAELGDFDCFVLGNLLMSQYPGTIVVPDFGFYAAPFHVGFIRQQRLVAGLTSFDEVPKLRHHLVQIEAKVGSRATPEDAEILARYCGFPRGSNAYNDFLADCIS